MKLKNITDKLELEMNKYEEELMAIEVKKFISSLNGALRKKKIRADVFVGGSYAKKTMIKSENYDIDIFIRFHKDGNLSDALENALKLTKTPCIRVHGSRDYFQIKINTKITFEVIPILKIKKPKEAKNVTDLSYFHVNYVKRKTNSRISNEIRIAKQFFKAQGVYGAESYIGGISGYGSECLIIYYKTFENMAKAIVKAKDKIIIDPEKNYKGKEALIEMNGSKIESSIVLVDPTFKERNVLAALRNETFLKLKKSLEILLKKPKKEMFDIKDRSFIDEEMKKQAKKDEFVKIILSTDKQEGDIAGTKMKKFSDFLTNEVSAYFDVVKREYMYNGTKNGELYLIVKPKKEIIQNGPPLEMIESAKKFRKEHKKTFMKAGRLYARIDNYKNFMGFFNSWKLKNQKKISEMDINGLKIE